MTRFAIPAVLVLCTAASAPVPNPARPTPPNAAAFGPDSVIDRVLVAYGGIDVLRRIGAYRQEGLLVAVRSGEHARLHRISSGPETLGVLVEYPDRTELRLLEADRARRGATPESLAEVSGTLKDAMMLQAARAWLPWLLDLRRTDVVRAGSGQGTTILHVRVAPNLLLRVFVDDETSFIVRTESVLESAPGEVGFATTYADFRTVGGVVFAFREETFASGFHTGSTVIQSVEVNPQGEQMRLSPAGVLARPAPRSIGPSQTTVHAPR